MKFIAFAAAILLAVPNTANAQGGGRCGEIANYARSIMNARQAGVTIDELMKDAEDDMDAADMKLAKEIIIQAFSRDRFQSEEYRAQATQDFTNDIALLCYKGQRRTPAKAPMRRRH